MQATAGRLGRLLFLTLIVAFIGYVGFKRLYVSKLESKILEYIAVDMGGRQYVRVADLFEEEVSAEGAIVCVLGSYQSRAETIGPDGASTQNGDVSGVSMKNINEIIARNNIRAGEVEWDVVAIYGGVVVRKAVISNRNIKLLIDYKKSKTCVPYQDATLVKVNDVGARSGAPVVMLANALDEVNHENR